MMAIWGMLGEIMGGAMQGNAAQPVTDRIAGIFDQQDQQQQQQQQQAPMDPLQQTALEAEMQRRQLGAFQPQGQPQVAQAGQIMGGYNQSPQSQVPWMWNHGYFGQGGRY